MVKRVLKAILKTIMWILIGILGLLLLLSILIYTHPVQRFVTSKTSSILTQKTDYDISIGALRLRFPLKVSVEDILVRDSLEQTVLQSEKINVNVAFLPLLRGKINVREVDLRNTTLNYADSAGTMHIGGSLERLTVDGTRLKLRNSDVDVRSLSLKGADITMTLGESGNDETPKDSTSLVWKVNIHTIGLDKVKFAMNAPPSIENLNAYLENGKFERLEVDLYTQSVDIKKIELNKGVYSLLAGSTTEKQNEESESAEASQTEPWTVNVKRVKIMDNAFDYDVSGAPYSPGVDANHIHLKGIDIELESVYNRSTDIMADIKNLALTETSTGLTIESLKGGVVMDTAKVEIKDFTLITPNSLVTADALFDISILNGDQSANVSASINATVGAADIIPILVFTGLEAEALRGRNFVTNVSIEGTLANLQIEQLRASIDNNVFISANGHLVNIVSGNNMSGNIRLTGHITNAFFLRSFISDPSLRNRIGLPNRIALSGNVSFAGSTFTPNITITADEGIITLQGSVNTAHEIYDARVYASELPLYRFLPTDSLGRLSLSLTTKGHGFNPMSKRAAAEADLVISEFGYKGYEYDTLSLRASVNAGRMSALIDSRSEAADFNIKINGTLNDDNINAYVVSSVKNVDLAKLHLQSDTMDFSVDNLSLAICASRKGEDKYSLDMTMSQLAFHAGTLKDRVKSASINAAVEDRDISVRFVSEDLLLALSAKGHIDSLSTEMAEAVEILKQQIDSLKFDMEPIGNRLPRFMMKLSAGNENVAARIAAKSGIKFRKVNLNAVSPTKDSLNVWGAINSFSSSGLTLDTLSIGARIVEHRAESYVRMANRPGNIDKLGLLYLFAMVENNDARADFIQLDRERNVGFRIGVNADIFHDYITASLYPLDPIIAGERWSVNEGNYFRYSFDRTMFGNMRLDAPSKHFYLTSVKKDGKDSGIINADIAGIDIGKILNALPEAPPLGGILSADLNLGFAYDIIVANGTLNIDGVSYVDKSPGDVSLQFMYLLDSLQTHRAGVKLDVNKKEAVDIGAEITMTEKGRRSHLIAKVPDFPLDLVNMFLPSGAVEVSGALHGRLDAIVEEGNTLLNGLVSFSDTEIKSPLIGTSFKLASDTLNVAQNRLVFDDYRIYSANGQSLHLIGNIDLQNFSQPTADMIIMSRNFQAVNSPRSRGSTVYGTANLDINITARGPLDALTIRGGARLLNGTNVGFTPEQSLTVQNTQQNIVRFVSFDDEQALAKAESMPKLQTRGMDILLNLDIDSDVRATVNLSPTGSDRLELQGGGTLTYAVNTQGDERFSGRYSISSGRVLYNPPLISQKDFAINDGGYMEWAGDMLNPMFNITASETIRTTVTGEDETSRTVDFVVTIILSNTLEDMDIRFDLSAPNDIVIQSQLASLDAEQRFMQALTLLISNTYTGPGTSASVNTGINNSLNSFVENELNNWARNNLSGVDVSFGINSYEDNLTNEQRTDYSYKVSKRFFNDRVTISVGGSIASDQNATANIQNNLIEDITVEYRITQRDNMFIKVFRINTTDMLEGEITKTGFGFIVRRKMNSLNELFRLSTKRKVQRQLERWRKEQEAQRAAETNSTTLEEAEREQLNENAADNEVATEINSGGINKERQNEAAAGDSAEQTKSVNGDEK